MSTPASTATDIDLTPFREPFKALVLQHISQKLDPNEWADLRELSLNPRRHLQGVEPLDIDATPDKLLDAALCEEAMSVRDILVPVFEAAAVEIGAIEGQPVRYVKGQGIYVWGPRPDSGAALSFWITHPAYPPRW